MPVTFVQNRANDANPASSLARAFASNVAAGNLLLVYCWQGHDSTDDTGSWTVSDTRGNTFTRFAHSSETTFTPGGSTGSKHAIFAAISGSGGADTITVDFGASKNYARMAIWEWKGTAYPVDRAIADSAAATGYFVIEVPYFYRTSTTASDPGSGNMRLNNATLSSATEAYFDSLDAFAVNRVSFLTGLVGKTLRMVQDGQPTRYVEYTVNSAVDNSGWVTLTLTYLGVGGGGNPSQTDNTAWWYRLVNNESLAPAVTGVRGGRVGAAMQDLNGGGTGYTVGSGYENLINTVSDGFLGSEDKATPISGTQQPGFGTTHADASFGISWALRPVETITQTIALV